MAESAFRVLTLILLGAPLLLPLLLSALSAVVPSLSIPVIHGLDATFCCVVIDAICARIRSINQESSHISIHVKGLIQSCRMNLLLLDRGHPTNSFFHISI